MSKLRTEWDNNKSLEFIQIRYTDVLGKYLARYLSAPGDIEGFFRHGIGLDGSSVRGFTHIDDSDLFLLPDITTARSRGYISALTRTHSFATLLLCF
jgi:glutamine synthetase